MSTNSAFASLPCSCLHYNKEEGGERERENVNWTVDIKTKSHKLEHAYHDINIIAKRQLRNKVISNISQQWSQL